MSAASPPPLAALFLVVFDQKVGYTIAWKRTRLDEPLDGVEFRCLPSGLHGVKEDLVYFVHSTHAGVSAFVQGDADEQHRNANFIAVGALVPLSYGRLGKSWLHAAELRRLASVLVEDGVDKGPLENYWQQHGHNEQDGVEATSPSMVRSMSPPTEPARKRKRAVSNASTTIPETIPADHPALSISALLDTFGPLVFPLYRAALLRKRILLLGSPPVQQTCNFVYLLSVLSGIPQTLLDVIQPNSETSTRIQTLFNVGIHDIPFLGDSKRKSRWLACTTDDILGEKKDLYDILVNLRPSTIPSQRPTIRAPDGSPIKATQRDLRRYRLLRAELDRIQAISSQFRDNPDNSDPSDDGLPLLRTSTTNLLQEVKHAEPNEADVVEPVSWAAMAYNGFMWWASAGEMEAWENDEARTDRQLLDDLAEIEDLLPRLGADEVIEDENSAAIKTQGVATLVTGYFHRLTAQTVQPLAELVDDADDETEEGIANAPIPVTSDDMRAMGLDNWSLNDKEFVSEMMQMYFCREATLESGSTTVCGVTIC